MAETMEETAERVKGWRIKSGEPRQAASDVLIKEVKSLDEYVAFILTLEQDKANPIFYRGHFNASYYPLPIVMRGHINHEDTIIKEFSRRFPNEVAEQKTTLEKIALMQHFGLSTRAMDISENPLVSLAFACNRYPYSAAKESETDDLWGEVILFRETQKSENHHTADIKYTESITTSIIANIAKCENEFYLGLLRIFFLQDGHFGHEENFMKFQDIMSQSIIVRAPLANQRHKNQQGAYILCAANEIIEVSKGNSRSIPSGVDAQWLTKELLKSKNANFSLGDLHLFPELAGKLKDSKKWDFKFKKVKSYSPEMADYKK